MIIAELIGVRPSDRFSFEDGHPLLRTLSFPSALLERHKLEILVHRISLPDGNGAVPAGAGADSLLTPSLEAQASFSGRVSQIVYPVHKSLVLGDGVQGVLGALSLLKETQSRAVDRMVWICADVDWPTLPSLENEIIFVNILNGQTAISELRQSLQNSTAYEKDWLSSGLSEVNAIVLEPPEQDNAAIKSTIRNLIARIVEGTESAVAKQEVELELDTSLKSIPESIREPLQEGITSWAESAHTELLTELQNVFNSRSWHKLSWWKLPWRVDDVEMIASEALRRTYLIDAEKNIIFIAGCIDQAGLLGATSVSSTKDADSHTNSKRLLWLGEDDIPPLTTQEISKGIRAATSDTLDSPSTASPDIQTIYHNYPWPQQIAISRMDLLHNTVPPLTALAQRLLLSFLSTTGLTSALSILAYISISPTSLYEAGGIAALGLTWSARRLQTRWEKARQDWVLGVELEGKRVLDFVERRCRLVVRNVGRRLPDEVGVEERRKARAAVMGVRRALEALEKENKVDKM